MSEHETDIHADGRQSLAALNIQRGTCRMLRALGHSMVTELPLSSGHRADILSMSRNGEVWITTKVIEFKVVDKLDPALFHKP